MQTREEYVETPNDLEPEADPPKKTNMCLVYNLTFVGVWLSAVYSLNANGTIILFDSMKWSKFRLGLIATFAIFGIVIGTIGALIGTEIFGIMPLSVMAIMNIFAVLGRIVLAISLSYALHYEFVVLAAFLDGIAR